MGCEVGDGSSGYDRDVSSRLHNLEQRSLKIPKSRLTEGEGAKRTDTLIDPRNTRGTVMLREHQK